MNTAVHVTNTTMRMTDATKIYAIAIDFNSGMKKMLIADMCVIF
jgi:hypothetical protein